MAILFSDLPERIPATPAGSCFFVPCGCVDPIPKVLDRFQWPLHVESEAVGFVAIARMPPSRRVGLNEIGKSYPHLDLCFPHLFQNVTWPRQVVDVHVAQPGLPAGLAFERMQTSLDHHGQGIRYAPERAFEVRHSEPAPSNQLLVVPLRRISVPREVGPLHFVGPFCGMDDQGTHRFWPQVWIVDHDLGRHPRCKRGGRACSVGRRERPVCRPVVGCQQAQAGHPDRAQGIFGGITTFKHYVGLERPAPFPRQGRCTERAQAAL